MACNTHSTGAIARASIPSNFSRRLALLGAALVPAAAVAPPETTTTPAGADKALVEAAGALLAALRRLRATDTDQLSADHEVDAALDVFFGARERMLAAGTPTTIEGVVALAAAVRGLTIYEAGGGGDGPWEADASPQELAVVRLADAILGRTCA